MLFEENSKKVKVTPQGIYLLDPELQKKVSSKKLSASLINSWLKSPADWVLDTYILPEVAKEETPHLVRGNWFHETMEVFFSLPPEKRTTENLLKAGKYVTERIDPKTNTAKYLDFSKDEENKEWYKNALLSYNNTWLENAKNEKIAQLYIMGQNQKGLEIYVQGKIGNAQRQCLGFVDKVVEGENGLIVQDWKTGKSIEDFNPSKKISQSNSFDYWRQQTLYSMLLEQYGANIEGACLIFPCATPPSIVNVDQKNEKVRNQVIADVEQVDREYEEAIQNGFFYPFKSHKYASWASYLGGLGNAKAPNIYEDKFMMIAEIES